MKRESGYYWVKYDGYWMVMRWNGRIEKWFEAGYKQGMDDDRMSEIDETIITRKPVIS